VSRLSDLYYELVQDEGPIELEAFLERVARGEHGEFSPEEIEAFIDETLGMMIENIRVKASEAPYYEEMAAQVEAETYERIKTLKEKYGRRRS